MNPYEEPLNLPTFQTWAWLAVFEDGSPYLFGYTLNGSWAQITDGEVMIYPNSGYARALAHTANVVEMFMFPEPPTFEEYIFVECTLPAV